MSGYDAVFSQPPSIMTRAKLEMLRSRRTEAQPALQPTPAGAGKNEAVRAASAAREDRINQLEERFRKIREGFETSLVFSSLEGRAKSQFEKSR